MRRPTLALSSALAAIGLSAAVASAQQPMRGPTPLSRPPSPLSRAVLPESPPSDTPIDPMLASKATRYLLRNGMDYLAYREYARALSFFRAVEARQSELSPADLDSLKKGIARAQQGLREAVNTTRVVSQPVKGRATVQPGALALAQPPTTESVQLASAELPAPPPITPSAAPSQAQPEAPAPTAAATEGVGLPQMPARVAAPAMPSEPPPDRSSPAPAEPAVARAPTPAPTPAQESPEVVPAGLPANPPPPIGLELPAAPDPAPTPASSPVELPPAGLAPMPAEPGPAPTPVPVPVQADAPAPVAETSPSPIELPPGNSAPVPMPSEPAPSLPGPVEPIPAAAVPPRVALASERGDASPPVPMPAASASASSSIPELPPPADAASLPPLPGGAVPAGATPTAEGSPLPPLPGEAGPARVAPASSDDSSESILPPRLRREIEELAQVPRGTDRPGAGAADPADPNAPSMPSQGSTRLELQRAPSPTEARPIRRIPVPEEYVPLGPREWNPGRKYWAAAGTCHMTLYFQDPVLERYGQGVEQSLGPVGRYFSYPLDDPRQSNQRNQILQPFYSIGKLCFQVGTLPYKILMDPPWESEYDLGYYRPGDPIPPDTIYITPTGVGPPLKGRHY